MRGSALPVAALLALASLHRAAPSSSPALALSQTACRGQAPAGHKELCPADRQSRGGRPPSLLSLRGGDGGQMTMGQEFAEYLKQYEAQGQKFENLTPEQYAARGLAGASYDVHGNIQFAPPGMTPEEAFQDMEKACEYYENLGVEEYMAEIDQALEDNDDSDRVDPLDKAFEHGGVHKNPGLLDGINKMVADSVDSLHQMGYTRDMETGDWTAPPDAEDVEREEALRSAFAIEALKTGGGARQTLQLIDDTEDDGCRARAVRDMDAGPSDEEDDFGGAGERLEATMHDME